MVDVISGQTTKYRVITYIDGFNLYFGIREQAFKLGSRHHPNEAWYRYMWINPWEMSQLLLTDSQELVQVRYFTARISGKGEKQSRQNAYLDALKTVPGIRVTFGTFKTERKECEGCGRPAFSPQEKKTDVNIATHLICDAFDDKYDTAIVISGDSDLIPALQAVKRIFPLKRLVVAFPPNRFSNELKSETHVKPIHIWEPVLRKSRFPPTIERDGLPDILCPEKYSGVPECTKRKDLP